MIAGMDEQSGRAGGARTTSFGDSLDQLLEALFDSWARNNRILVNLLHATPEGGLEARAMEGSPTVAEMFTHMHYVRVVFLFRGCAGVCGRGARGGVEG